MTIRNLSHTSGLLVGALALWSVTALSTVRACPVHDGPADLQLVVDSGAGDQHDHGPTEGHGPADEHDGHDCQCIGHCSPASQFSAPATDAAILLALKDSGLVDGPEEYSQPAPTPHPWLLPPANGPPVA